MTQQVPRHSLAHRQEDGRLYAPSAERNAGPIADLLRRHAPAQGNALELASGTGQHAVHFARALPGLVWQPTEIAPERIASIRLWRAEAGLDNLLEPLELNATTPGWARDHGRRDLIVLVNLLHLIPGSAARTLIAEAAAALAPGGRLVLYGPFLRQGQPTSEGDRQFHANLQAEGMGYHNDETVAGWLHDAGLEVIEIARMPANNLAFVASPAPEPH